MTTSKVKEIVSHLFTNQIYHEIGSAITNFMISILLCTRKNTSQLGFPAWMGAGFLLYTSFSPVEWGSYISFLPNIPAANSDIATLPKDSNERKLLFWRLLLFGLGGASGMQLRGEQEPSPVKAPFKSAGSDCLKSLTTCFDQAHVHVVLVLVIGKAEAPVLSKLIQISMIVLFCG